MEVVPAICKETLPIAHDSLHGQGCIKLSPESIDNELEVCEEVEKHGFVDLLSVGAVKGLHRRCDLGVQLCGNAPDGDVDKVKGHKAHLGDSIRIERGSHCGKEMDTRRTLQGT
jgi:hypothetical protein